jgi:2-iminobutanoate/2-iminopropanoate deaminase
VAVRHCLEADGTSFDNVVMVRIHAANARFHYVINRVYARNFPDPGPSPWLRAFVV